jgi:tetratricopeptide (TPR) repeat protein
MNANSGENHEKTALIKTPKTKVVVSDGKLSATPAKGWKIKKIKYGLSFSFQVEGGNAALVNAISNKCGLLKDSPLGLLPWIVPITRVEVDDRTVRVTFGAGGCTAIDNLPVADFHALRAALATVRGLKEYRELFGTEGGDPLSTVVPCLDNAGGVKLAGFGLAAALEQTPTPAVMTSGDGVLAWSAISRWMGPNLQREIEGILIPAACISNAANNIDLLETRLLILGAAETDPFQPGPAYNLAKASWLFAHGETQRAIRATAAYSLDRLDPGLRREAATLFTRIAVELTSAGLDAEARKFRHRAISALKRLPFATENNVKIAELYEQIGDANNAIIYFSSSGSLNDTTLQAKLLNLHAASGRFAQLKAFYAGIAASPPDRRRLEALADAAGKFPAHAAEIVSWIVQAIGGVQPDHELVARIMQLISHLPAGEQRPALFKSLASGLRPDAVGWAAAEAALAAGNPAEAVRLMESVVKGNPPLYLKSRFLHFLRVYGVKSFAGKDLSQAKECFSRAFLISSEDKDRVSLAVVVRTMEKTKEVVV